jgi:hypothetical protein
VFLFWLLQDVIRGGSVISKAMAVFLDLVQLLKTWDDLFMILATLTVACSKRVLSARIRSIF